MNWADLIIIGAIFLFALSGYTKGAIKQIGDFASLVLSIVFSFWFFEPLGAKIAAQTGMAEFFANLAAFFAIWILVQIVFGIAFYIFYPVIPEGLRKSKINKAAGAIPGFLWGALFVSLLVLLVSIFPFNTGYKAAVENSASGSFIIETTKPYRGYFTDIAGTLAENAREFLTISPNSEETVDLGFKVEESDLAVDEVAEEEMLRLLNAERKAEGLGPLVMDEKLRELARDHSRDMFLRGYFAHTNPDGQDPFDRMNERGIIYKIAGENLALAPNVNLAHDGLMNSPGHRANILKEPYGKVGIGCIDGGGYGKMFSQEFTN